MVSAPGEQSGGRCGAAGGSAGNGDGTTTAKGHGGRPIRVVRGVAGYCSAVVVVLADLPGQGSAARHIVAAAAVHQDTVEAIAALVMAYNVIRDQAAVTERVEYRAAAAGISVGPSNAGDGGGVAAGIDPGSSGQIIFSGGGLVAPLGPTVTGVQAVPVGGGVALAHPAGVGGVAHRHRATAAVLNVDAILIHPVAEVVLQVELTGTQLAIGVVAPGPDSGKDVAPVVALSLHSQGVVGAGSDVDDVLQDLAVVIVLTPDDLNGRADVLGGRVADTQLAAVIHTPSPDGTVGAEGQSEVVAGHHHGRGVVEACDLITLRPGVDADSNAAAQTAVAVCNSDHSHTVATLCRAYGKDVVDIVTVGVGAGDADDGAVGGDH